MFIKCLLTIRSGSLVKIFVKICFWFVCPLAVAVIQSIPIFNDTKFLSIPLPGALGSSLSFSYILQLYLVLMFLGESLLQKSHWFLKACCCCDISCSVIVLLSAVTDLYYTTCTLYRPHQQPPPSVQAEAKTVSNKKEESQLRNWTVLPAPRILIMKSSQKQNYSSVHQIKQSAFQLHSQTQKKLENE